MCGTEHSGATNRLQVRTSNKQAELFFRPEEGSYYFRPARQNTCTRLHDGTSHKTSQEQLLASSSVTPATPPPPPCSYVSPLMAFLPQWVLPVRGCL
jgi:hypothetical protein